MSKRRRRILLVVILVMAALALCPFSTTTVPAQSVLVIDEQSRPIKGVCVRQIWQNYSLESLSHEEDGFTDDDGRVVFPKRTLWATALWRAVGPPLQLVQYGVHASFGPSEDMFTLGTGEVLPSSRPIARPPGVRVFQIRGREPVNEG